MSDEAHSKTHSELERELEQQGREQATALSGAPGADGLRVRRPLRCGTRRGRCGNRAGAERGLETVFGEVRVERLELWGRGAAGLHPLDHGSELPPELYSHQVLRRAAEEAAEGSFDKVWRRSRKPRGRRWASARCRSWWAVPPRTSMPSSGPRQAGAWLRAESGSILALGGRQRRVPW